MAIARKDRDVRTAWEKDVDARRRIRADVKGLTQRAVNLKIPIGLELEQASAYLSGRKINDARWAIDSLTWAANECTDPDLRERIKAVEQELYQLIW
ncbi:MAG: hypothetical protein F4X40_08555 [Chloroflexi bacterium]|nr:hypothetical protein [Chloroflexota bacterium]